MWAGHGMHSGRLPCATAPGQARGILEHAWAPFGNSKKADELEWQRA